MYEANSHNLAGWIRRVPRDRSYTPDNRLQGWTELQATDCSAGDRLYARSRHDDHGDAERIFRAARAGTATEDEATALRRHLLLEMARMSVEDGLVMTLHPGVHRNHHAPTLKEYGPDTGHDIPVAVEYTRARQPLLERYRGTLNA